MWSGEKIKVVQAGATGPVAETFRDIIAQPGSPLELESVAASRDEHVGKRLGDIAIGPCAQENVPVISLDDAVHNTSAQVVFSSLRNDAASEYEDQLARGRTLATNAGVNRMRNDVALANAYFNGEQIDELYAEPRPGYIIANGNCTSIILSTALAPLHRSKGIDFVRVETLQGWSGAGVSQVPDEHESQVIPITGDEKEKIETEPKKFLGSMQKEATLSIHATPQRGPWVRGHYEKVVAILSDRINRWELEEIWQDYKAPSCLEGINIGNFTPETHPIVVDNQQMLRKTSNGLMLKPVPPMQVLARTSYPRGNTEAKFEITGDNLVLGAAGASVMNILYAMKKGYVS